MEISRKRSSLAFHGDSTSVSKNNKIDFKLTFISSIKRFSVKEFRQIAFSQHEVAKYAQKQRWSVFDLNYIIRKSKIGRKFSYSKHYA